MENMKDGIENIKITKNDTSERCPECGQEFINKILSYCKPCYSAHFRNNFTYWTSGNLNIDELIQNSQLNANDKYELIEWIEYSNFKDVEFVANGGFGSVYKAIWQDGPIEEPFWNIKKSEWNRNSFKEVAIKKFRNATSVSLEFLKEVRSNLMLNYSTHCNGIYGVTCDPQNGEYAIVAKFQNDGNLREMIKKNYSILNWRVIIKILHNISNGLYIVHNKNYLHRDLHSGNILNKLKNDPNLSISVISDFGLCCPANQSSEDKPLYGVLPFVAPEVLRGGEFTNAADIYGFGMLMSEIINGNAPFVDRDYDLHLALDICGGERPLIPEYTPEPYAALMKCCWDPIPTNRPSANELLVQTGNWEKIICKFEFRDSQLTEEFSQEREDIWKARLAELAINPHPLKISQNMLTSKRLYYSKQLTQLLETKDVEMKTNVYHTRQFDMSL
ncbi:kinase-like domain-containing protein [Rhizophagus irregularis DAOM 181602=DAOM 197198]|uniref:Kinase-like domain-containing protein n=1 Tax=Rhizophagus irregularis (strain DAOM 181602 / DAOM 197198 / MUCL 43194) TaxID=747089 RepID=A0A2H5SQ96_RHIID|nr:kinase-like domain-containing protein [Rhizophagus irregularis DAOM 181602=DAOM 197198]POG78578.1 kinase-like domain-containing protein [Rhizophagus irregularis DAOM 181602=DAOM 197198]GBC32509.1 kinase-like domain-containing protein [Rhizophagus irregularis DAOM 181602=DAOM 197198]|eukprot:XP_025185444.1 kinase-like domain-containing protein [Rhizophagus irregularis DAOM 181602=DAOM 197198]